MKVIFMGTPSFAVPALKELIKHPNYDVVAVFSQAPKQKGRKLQISKSAVHLLAEEHNIAVHTPPTLKTTENQQLVLDIDADVIIVAAYGFIIPKVILESKKYGCINIHPSRLPRHRGAAPLQHSILSGDKQSSVCIMQMDEGLDTGDVLVEEIFDMPTTITLPELHDKCAYMGARLLIHTLDNISTISPKPQSEIGATYAHKISKEDGKVNWHEMDATTIIRMLRGLNPWPGIYFQYDTNLIKIIEAVEISTESSSKAGIVLDDKLTIKCKEGAIRILSLQKPGKKAVSTQDFLNGNPIKQGTQL